MPTERRSDGDTRFYKMVTRLHPSQLGPGEVALSENGRMDIDGVWQCREGYENVASITLTDSRAVTLAGAGEAGSILLIGVLGSNATASGTTTVTVDTSTDGDYIPSDPGHTFLVNLDGFTGGSGTLDGNHEATYVSNTTFTVEASGVSGSWTGGTVGPPRLSGDVIAIRGAGLFSDPDDSNNDYIVIADNTQATAVKISDRSKTTVAFPSGETLNQKCDIIQEFDVVMLRQEGKTSWYFDPDDPTNGFGGTPAFVKMSSGSYTQPGELEDTTAAIDTDGKVTIDLGAGTHGLSTGDKVTVIDAGSTDLTEGDEYIVTVVDANEFYFYADIDDTGGGGGLVMRKRVSVGGGYVHAPGAAWGVYHQRRSWVPYNYDSAATPNHRGVEDEIIASDLLDNDTYDPIGNQFRVSGGTADFTVALHGFDDDRLLVFNRNSIHYLSGVSGALGDVQTIHLTNEIGCVARKSVVSYANQVLFLSDNGVYSVSFLDEYNLRGTDLPLSEAVESIIRRVTKSAADGAIGVYHNNRYWLALPVDGAEFNNAILVYNFLNGGWESLDTTSADGAGWCVEELVTARAGKVNELYAVTTYGGLHKLDGTGRDKDLVITRIGSSTASVLDIPAAVTTRQYLFSDLQRKKFNRVRVNVESSDDQVSQADLDLIVQDPDQTVALGELRDKFTGGLSAGEEGTFETRLGNPRGFGAQLKMTVESGLPKLRHVQIDGVAAFTSTTSVS